MNELGLQRSALLGFSLGGLIVQAFALEHPQRVAALGILHAAHARTDAQRAAIMQRVEENGVRLVIIDTLQKLFKFKDVNDYSQVINAMDPLIEAAGEKKVHILFLHHP